MIVTKIKRQLELNANVTFKNNRGTCKYAQYKIQKNLQ